MRQKKLNYIESYIYAKTLYLTSINIEIPQNNEKIKQFIIKSQLLSKKMLFLCETQINENKLNNPSFLLLKRQLEEISYPKNTLLNYNKLKKMLKNFNHYFSLIT